MPQTIRPGDVLADRYRLIDLLSEAGEGRFFRAHDKVLDRHVALHIIAADDPRAPGGVFERVGALLRDLLDQR